MNNPITVFGKPIEKLITVIAQGVGILYEPSRIRRKADADAYRLEKLAEAKALGLIKESDAKLTIFDRSQNRQVAQEIDRQINIENIAAISISHLNENTSKDPVDENWRIRFFTKAQDVYHDDLQEIWGKILAEEINSPGKTSLRTLDIVSNITASEGKIFELFCSMCFDHVGLYHPFNGEIHTRFGLKYSDIQILRSARLVHENDNIISPLRYNDAIKGAFLSFSGKIYVISNDTRKDFTFEVISLTAEGMELMELISASKDFSYFNKFMAECLISKKLIFHEASIDELNIMNSLF